MSLSCDILVGQNKRGRWRRGKNERSLASLELKLYHPLRIDSLISGELSTSASSPSSHRHLPQNHQWIQHLALLLQGSHPRGQNDTGWGCKNVIWQIGETYVKCEAQFSVCLSDESEPKRPACKSDVRQLLFCCWTLHHLFKKEQMGPRRWRARIDPHFHWFPPSLFFFPLFPPVAERGDGSGSSYEKLFLWIRMVKRRAPRWGAAWTITAAAALQTRCTKGLPLQPFPLHPTRNAAAAKLPSPNEGPELLNFCRVDVRDTKRHAGSAWKLA